ncbi:MAG: hypothetical protein J0I12_24260 [Candidatus Eremiobacteraeota bacterium]|nr:hypothetical protein [Candidatus Eremiobacteraeota bacterium]
MAAGMITNFNQQAADQQRLMLDRMRAVCPGTAAIGENLRIQPSNTGDMYFDDTNNARNNQGLTNVLGAACAVEAAGGGAPQFPSFLLGY